jgi:hypothetical protein
MTRLTLPAFLALTALSSLGADWPQFRGPKGDGIVADAKVPTKWSTTENVLWKAEVPGGGHSSPVVAGGRVFLTSFDPDTNERLLICYDRADGKRLWTKAVLTAQPEKMHKNSTPAGATPATDGTHVYVAFLDVDKVAVACYDFAGKPLWLKKPGEFLSHHGFCGTPVLYRDTVIVVGDSDGPDAFVAALDKKTGETKWKAARPNRTRSFSVPLFVEVGGKTQMVLAGSKCVTSFDPDSGKPLWVADSPTDKFVATVAYSDGLIFATGTSPKNTLAAIDPTGSGNVTATHVRWSDARTAAYVPSPLARRGRLFVLSDAGIATMLESKTGKVVWSERLGPRLYHASPLLINDLIYCLAEDGTAHVLKWADEFEVVEKNAVAEGCNATPAVSDGRLFVRSAGMVWCFGEKPKR